MNSKHFTIHVFTCMLIASGFSDAAEPRRDIAYDTKHERNVLDFWPALKSDATSDEPAPVLIWFHPGGTFQSKSHV